MKRIQTVFLLLAAAIAITSCKENSSEVVPPAEKDYLKLKTGNYWVYAFYQVDSTGAATQLTATDSAYIIGDTLLDGQTYFLKVQNLYQFTKSGLISNTPDTIALRDSSGYLIQRSPTGQHTILFARDNFTDILHHDSTAGVMVRELKMTGKDSIVTVPAGTFSTQSTCETIYPLQPSYPYGTRKYYTVYGSEIGQLIYSYGFYSSPNHYEARLVRYGEK